MLARTFVSTVQPVGFDRPLLLPLAAPPAARLDAALIVMPAVTRVGLDQCVETLLRPLGLAEAGLVVRRVRLLGGRSVTVAAVPSTVWSSPSGRPAVLALKQAARAVGRRVLLVPEAVLGREPFMTNPLLGAGCAESHVSPSDRLALMVALLDGGGSMPLADAAELMVRSDDPVAAVLSLVVGRVVGLDLRESLGPDGRVTSRPGCVSTSEAGR